MKQKCIYIFLLSVFIFVLFTSVIEANAMNTGFSIEELTQEEQNMFVSNASIAPLTVEPAKKPITCFDVNSNKLIAIGQYTPDKKTICVYSSEGVFQYGYTFNCDGYFGVEWDEERINIYFVRSNVIISLDSDGNISDIKGVQNTVDNNTHRNTLLHSTRRIVSDTTYLIRNDMGILNLFASSYSQIIVRDVTGIETIVYDANSMQLSNMIITIVIVCVFTSIVIATIARQFIKLKRGN